MSGSEEEVLDRVKSQFYPAEELTPHRSQHETDLMFPDNIVALELKDAAHPQGWSLQKKLVHTVSFGFTTLAAQFAAAILSPASEPLAREFHVGREVGILAMSVYVLGNGVGPMLFAPLSEVYGRKIGVLVPFFISACFMMIIANVNSIAAVVVLRFIAGVFAAAPIVSSGGAMADMWAIQHRAAALVLYGCCIVAGSSCAPVFGQLLLDGSKNYGWRWACWLAGIFGALIAVLNFIFLDETYLPVLNAKKAKLLRMSTGNWALHAKHEEWKFDLEEFFLVHCARPVMLFSTPIVFLMASYASFVYGIIFALITSVGRNFADVKGFKGATAYLPLLGNSIGFCVGGLANVANSHYFMSKLKANGGHATPEDRLPAMMMLSWLMPAGCFIYAWTLYEDVHWIAPCIGIVCVGAGIAVIFQGCLVYIVDSYTRYAASAIAANTLLRSLYGGVFPLFTSQLYDRLGVHWGSSLFGFLAVLMLPIPYAFYVYGARLRQVNPYAKHLT